MYYIYLIANVVNNKNYVGYTGRTPEKRLIEHIDDAKRQSTRALCKAIRKHGSDKFTLRYIGSANNLEQAKHFEERFIHLFKSFGPAGYNMNPGGIGGDTSKTPGYEKARAEGRFKNTLRKHSEEHVRKRTDPLRGRNRPVEVIAKMISTRKEKNIACGPPRGTRFSEEHKKNLSVAAKNRIKESCPHCGKTVDPRNFKRWHGDKCKQNA